MLDQQWLATFAPVGDIPAPGQWRPAGAGVFLAHHDLVWLVTAHHLVTGTRDLGVLVPIHGRPALVGLTAAMEDQPELEWLISPSHDIAVAPMSTPDGIGIKALSRDQCIPEDEVLASMPCLTGGCPYGLPGVDRQRTIPLVLDGVIAGTDPESRSIFISPPTFRGNSGGPIIVVRSPFDPAGGMTVGQQTVLLAGIVSEVHTIESDDANAAPLRLGTGVAIDVVFELLDGADGIAMAQRIKEVA